MTIVIVQASYALPNLARGTGRRVFACSQGGVLIVLSRIKSRAVSGLSVTVDFAVLIVVDANHIDAAVFVFIEFPDVDAKAAYLP